MNNKVPLTGEEIGTLLAIYSGSALIFYIAFEALHFLYERKSK